MIQTKTNLLKQKRMIGAPLTRQTKGSKIGLKIGNAGI